MHMAQRHHVHQQSQSATVAVRRRLHTPTDMPPVARADLRQQTEGVAAAAATTGVSPNDGPPAAAAAPASSASPFRSASSRLLVSDPPSSRLLVPAGMGGVPGALGFDSGLDMGMNMGGTATATGTATDPRDWSDRPLDPRMLDCILVRHGESEGNIGTSKHNNARVQRQRRSLLCFVAVCASCHRRGVTLCMAWPHCLYQSKLPRVPVPVPFLVSAYNRSWEGDHSLYTGAFLKRHSSLWRLTDRGREQAETAGAWLREHTRGVAVAKGMADALSHSQSLSSVPSVHRYYVSEYIRAMETAALMDLPDAKWFENDETRAQCQAAQCSARLYVSGGCCLLGCGGCSRLSVQRSLTLRIFLSVA